MAVKSGNPRELPAYFYRLSPRSQRCYLKSESVDHFDLSPDKQTAQCVASLLAALETGGHVTTAREARALTAQICRLLGVAPVAVEVRGVRPHNTRGELHGIFYGAPSPRIILWMRTAQRHDIVKPRTFFRTLMHEIGHYLDYELLKLEQSFHTGGFFRRESSLVRALLPPDRPDGRSGARA